MNWRVLAYAALPLILYPVLPVWSVLLLAGLYGLAARWPQLQPWRLALGTCLLAALHLPTIGSVLAGGGWLIDLVPLFGVLLLAWLALWLVSRAADDAGERGSRSWLYLLPVAALAPHPLSLVSLGSAFLLRGGPDSPAPNGPATRRTLRSVALLPWAVALAGVFFLSFALPSQSLWRMADQSLWNQAGIDQGGRRIYRQNVCREFYKDGTWVMYVGNGDGNWKEVDPASCGGGKPEEQASEQLDAASFLSVGHKRSLALVGLVLLAFSLLRGWGRNSRQTPVQDKPPEISPERPALTVLPPLHRVRAAYARTEAHLAAAGLVRQEAETPAEYLRRVSADWPGQASALAALGTAYATVRYGGGVTETQAEAAEQSAALILAGRPPAAPVSSDHSIAASFHSDSSHPERQGPA